MLHDYIRYAVRSSAVLTGSYVAGTVVDKARDFNQLIVEVDFTKGSLTSLEIKVEFSEDGTLYRQETFQSISSGTATETLGEHTMTATGKYEIKIPITTNKIKISVKGTGTVTNSLCAINAVLGTV